jgi:tripartite-type tricarboxylate transporter receptor subunit TctC
MAAATRDPGCFHITLCRSFQMRTRRFATAALLGFGALLALPSHAQTAPEWPPRLVRLVVPFASGGSTDLLARQLAQELGERLKTSVVVENRPGAGGTLGSEWVSQQPADGSVLLLGSVSTHAVAPSIYAKLKYEPLRDFTPLTVVATVPNVMVVRSDIPVNNLKEFVALTRKPGADTSFASNGQGTSNHLAMELLKTSTGMQAVHIPYKGSGPALTDTVAGHVTTMMDVIGTSLPYIKSGKLRALAVTSTSRSPTLPDVPTVAESGYPNFDAIVWFGLFAPPRMAPALSDRISKELIATIRGKKISEYLVQQGAQPSGITPAEFTRLIREDIAKWQKVAASAGIQPE